MNDKNTIKNNPTDLTSVDSILDEVCLNVEVITNNETKRLKKINENYYLDCSEFDDSIARIDKTLDNNYQSYVQTVNDYEQNFGYDYCKRMFEEDKDNVVKVLQEQNMNTQHELSHRLVINERDLELKFKELTDELSNKERELKVKNSELSKKLSLDITHTEDEILDSCQDVEIALLKTNDPKEISELKANQYQIRVDGLEKIATLSRECCHNIRKNESEYANRNNDLLIEINQLTLKRDVEKAHLKCALDVAIKKDKEIEKFYELKIKQDYVAFLNNYLKHIDYLISQSNDNNYLLQKDKLSLRLQQAAFVQSQFKVIIKDYLEVLESQLKLYFESVKKTLQTLKGFKKDILKIASYEDYLELSRYLISMIEKNVAFSERFSGVAIWNTIDNISYLNYSFLFIQDLFQGTLATAKEQLDLVVISLQENVEKLKPKKLITRLNEMVDKCLKIVDETSANWELQLTTIDYLNSEYIKNYYHNTIVAINSDTLAIDQRYNDRTLYNNDFVEVIIEQYHKYISECDNDLKVLEDFISKIDADENHIKEKEMLDAQHKCDESQKECEKILMHKNASIEKNFKQAMERIEKRRRNSISKL